MTERFRRLRVRCVKPTSGTYPTVSSFMMSELAVAFFWHQHQPYYPDDVGGQNPMPWVRLHGVKDYCGMALHLLEFPEMRCTINLVPSLLRADPGLRRRPGDRSPSAGVAHPGRRPDRGGLPLSARQLLHGQSAAHDPAATPATTSCILRRGPGKNTAQEALRRFKEHDLRDLQVWFNLAWVHPLAVERDPELQQLIAKGRHFTEEDKNRLLDKHLEIYARDHSAARQLHGSGQVELTTTPFYHPILPLLLDKKLAREAMPDVKLPRYTGGYPEDAAMHVRAGRRASHAGVRQGRRAACGRPRAASARPMIPLLAEHGIRWIATDEEILCQATQGFISRDEHGHVRNPELLYRPYKVRGRRQRAGHRLPRSRPVAT